MTEFHAGKCHYETHYYKQLIHANKSIKAVYCHLQNLRVHYNLTVTLFSDQSLLYIAGGKTHCCSPRGKQSGNTN